MKKIAFVLGYAGGILALVFSLLMIYTVPSALLGRTLEDLKDNMKNENVIALNAIGLYAKDNPITDFSENGLVEYAKDVSEKSDIFNDEEVYEDSVVFAYKTALHGIISAALIGVSVLFALVSFIGALVLRKKPEGAGVTMLIASLVLLLSAIYTGTALPMIAACVLLAAAGIAAFIPAGQVARQRPRRPKPQRMAAAPQYPQFVQYPSQACAQYPQSAQPNQPQYPQQQYPQNQQPQPPAADVPFPEVEVQVFAQPAADESIKE